MSKISVSFLVGFAVASSMGVAFAQTSVDPGAMSNSITSPVLSMDGMRAKAKLSEAKDANPFAQAAASLTGAPTSSGTGIDIPVVNAKIGSGTSFALPSNALMDASKDSSSNMANALQAAQPAGGAAQDMQSSVVLGFNTSDLSNALGDQVRSSQRLGK